MLSDISGDGLADPIAFGDRDVYSALGNGDGKADIVGFGNRRAYTSLSNSDGTFSKARLAVKSFGVNAGGWSSLVHFRKLGDINGDGMADIVGISSGGVYTSLSLGNGKYSRPVLALNARHFGETYMVSPSDTLADINGDGFVDIVTMRKKITTFLSNPKGGFRVVDQPEISFFNPYYKFISESTRALKDINGDDATDLRCR